MRISGRFVCSICVALSASFLLQSCSSPSPTQTNHEQGYVSLNVVYEYARPTMAKLAEVDEVAAYVYDADSTLLTHATLTHDTETGNATGALQVPVGTDRWLDLVASEQSTVVWLGRAGNIAIAEDETTDVSITMRTFAPSMLNIDNAGGDGDYTVTWTSVALAGQYALEESADQAFSSSTALATQTDTTYAVVDNDLGTYWYRARAVSGYGYGAWSNAKASTVSVGATGHIGIDIPWPGSATGYPEPLLHWSFDDPQHAAVDETAGGHPLTIPGTHQSIDRTGTDDAIHFDAYSTGDTGPYGPYTSTSSLTYPGSGGFTVTAWVKVTSGSTAIAVQDYGNGATSYFQLSVTGASPTAKFFVRSNVGATEDPIASYGVSSLVGQWVHLAGVYNATDSSIRLYIDGVARASGNTTTSMTTQHGPYLYVSGDFNETFDQSVDEVMLWDRALTEAEVQAVAGR